MKLARHLTIALVLGAFCVFAMSAYFRIRRESGLFEADISRDNRTMGRALSSAVLEVWKTEGEARALRVVSEANERESQVDIRWVWLDAPAGDQHRSLLSDGAIDAVRAGRDMVEKRPNQGAEYLVTCLPVKVPGARAGALELSESLAGEKAYVRRTIRNILISTSALTLVSGIITSAVGLWLVGRPMRALIEQARRIGAGDFTKRLDLRQRDEIGELAAEMNRMCVRLDEAYRKIERETAARMAAIGQLRHAERLATVGTLASGIAHELGTPLQIISGRAQMIAEGDAPAAEVAKDAGLILEQARRMTRIIRQLLDFARRGTAEKVRTDLRGIVTDTLALLRPLADKQNVVLAQRAPDAPAEVEVDPDQVRQAITNVVVNGIQSMPRGGSLTVALRRESVRPPAYVGGPEGHYVALSVEDEGVGIPEDAKEHIFEPFFTTKPVGEGTGLGLSVAYGIVREHDGWIDVARRPGAGSVFTIYFPGESES